jgi:soluble lytic murein transglycosylase-like protein
MFSEIVTFTVAVFAGIQPFGGSTQTAQYVSPLPLATAIPTPLPTSTPTPTPIPTAMPTPTPLPVIAPGELDSLFTKYAQAYQVDAELIKRIAQCESKFNTQAENGPYAGLFQFLDQTWTGVRTRMGENPDVELRKNTEEAIKTAAYHIARGGKRAWANCL